MTGSPLQTNMRLFNQELIHTTKINVNEEEQNKENKTEIGVYQYIFVKRQNISGMAVFTNVEIT